MQENMDQKNSEYGHFLRSPDVKELKINSFSKLIIIYLKRRLVNNTIFDWRNYFDIEWVLQLMQVSYITTL